jgi:hypothetical protein
MEGWNDGGMKTDRSHPTDSAKPGEYYARRQNNPPIPISSIFDLDLAAGQQHFQWTTEVAPSHRVWVSTLDPSFGANKFRHLKRVVEPPRILPNNYKPGKSFAAI